MSSDTRKRVFDTPIQSQFGLALAGRVRFSDLSKAIIPLGSSLDLNKGLQRGVTAGRKKRIVGLLEGLNAAELNVTEQWHVSVTTDQRPTIGKSVDIQELLANAKEMKILDGGGRYRSFQRLSETEPGWNDSPIQVMVYVNPTRLEELQAIWILNFRRTQMTTAYQVWLYASMMRDPNFEIPGSGRDRNGSGKDRNDHLYAQAAWELAHAHPLAGNVKFHDDTSHSAKLTIANVYKGIDASEKAVKYFVTIDEGTKKSQRERGDVYTAIWLGFQSLVGALMLQQLLYCEGPSVMFNLVTAAGLEILRKRKNEKLYESEMAEIVARELDEPWRLFNEQHNPSLTFAGDTFNNGGDATKMRTVLLDMITPNRAVQLDAEREAERLTTIAQKRADRAARKAQIAAGAAVDDEDDAFSAE